jgi:hypothetical protein
MQIGHLRPRYLWGPAVDQILAEGNVDNGADETAQWTLTDHLNTVRDIAKHDPGSDMTTVVNHLIYDALGRVTSENKNLSENLNIGVIPWTQFGFRIGVLLSRPSDWPCQFRVTHLPPCVRVHGGMALVIFD